MTTYYVGSGGSDAANGLTWATRKLTLNGAEDVPVAAGDTVYVGAGTYRELLTVDVAGSSGNPITYIGDFTGANTDGVGGVVRITGSNDDQTATRANCVSLANNRSFRTFRGFTMDLSSGAQVNLSASSSNLIVENCYFHHGQSTTGCIVINGTGGSHIIRRCFFYASGTGMQITHTATVNNTATLIENCFFICPGNTNGMGVRVDRVGGITIKNCNFIAGEVAIRVQTALAAGQTLTVNNCIITDQNIGFQATVTGELVEDYNYLYATGTPRTNVTAGANSVAYPPFYDTRWFFQALSAGAGPNSQLQMLTPFDLASYSQAVNLAGTSPATTDLRGTGTIGAQREYGALEYDASLKTKPTTARARALLGLG